jgi:hypothetical protein
MAGGEDARAFRICNVRLTVEWECYWVGEHRQLLLVVPALDLLLLVLSSASLSGGYEVILHV